MQRHLGTGPYSTAPGTPARPQLPGRITHEDTDGPPDHRYCRFPGVAAIAIYAVRAEIVRLMPVAPGTGRTATVAPDPAGEELLVWAVWAGRS